MKRSTARVFGAAFTLLVGTAHAGTVLNSQAVEVRADEFALWRIVNVGTNPIDVTNEALDSRGNILDTERSRVDPGQRPTTSFSWRTSTGRYAVATRARSTGSWCVRS